MNIKVGSIIHLKSGLDLLVTAMPFYDKFYCRTLTTKEFKVVTLEDVQYVHPTQSTLWKV